MEKECRALVSDPRRGKNMFALGMLCHLYSFELNLAVDQIARAIAIAELEIDGQYNEARHDALF